MRDKESQNKKIKSLIGDIRESISLVRDENKTIIQEKKDLLAILVGIENIFENNIRFDKGLLDMAILDKLIKKNQDLSNFENKVSYSSISLDDGACEEKKVFLKRFRLILRDLAYLLSIKDEIISFDDVDISFNKTRKEVMINKSIFSVSEKNPLGQKKYKGIYKILFYIISNKKFIIDEGDLEYKKISKKFFSTFGGIEGKKPPKISNFYLALNNFI